MKILLNPHVKAIFLFAATVTVFSQTNDSIASVTIDILPPATVVDSSAVL